MLPDFSASYADIIGQDGTISPLLWVQAGEMAYAADADGLLMTTQVGTIFGEEHESCLLSVLFRMPVGKAQADMRAKRFPAKPGDFIAVKRAIDEVVGDSGERYTRFDAEVWPCPPPGHEELVEQ